METIHNTADLRRCSRQLVHHALNSPGFPKRREVKLSQVVYLEGVGNYVCFHLLDDAKLMVAYTLASYESLPGFMRIHKKHIVNVMHISSLDVRSRGEALVHLTNDVQLIIARRQMGMVVAQLNSKVETPS
ncbi:LytR/AlgR family response regulator transcription factor [Spirosoma utsteinense]|uniref:DNA-binding LytR/AlgR family response regulator n=1 Tax=Spirosoma utsteinense TaxID=2585773 RepID=A0ABR6WET8_9BACT|nr:LytTR family DNA-binding domain-containing protein [Spirosoma utsteinense]MBC3787158.1 DNA-binding LytR/AlgR family response regulator [Spirosoma utsteinense]MBC3795047.1 DNA-binding LytR/AlgR family response regulator [Spirosoma utsteinense]